MKSIPSHFRQLYYVPDNDLGIASGVYTFDGNSFMVNPVSTDKDGVYFENGAWYYYEDGTYIYVRTNGELATGSYWITNHNGLLTEGMYQFDANGILIEN